LFRSSWSLWICDPLALSRAGSLANRLPTPLAVFWLTYGLRPALACPVRKWLKRGLLCDRDDAISIGLAALDGAGITQVTCDDALVSLRLLCDRREELGRLRTPAVCRLHRLLAELTPGGIRGERCASKA